MTVHIIGAGLSGLSAAVTLTERHLPVALYDAAFRTGGRCGSFDDKKLDAVLDYGTHLLFAANTTVLNLLKICGAKDTFRDEGDTVSFFDCSAKRFFDVHMNLSLKTAAQFLKLYPLISKSVMNTPFKTADKTMLFKTLVKCVQKDGNRVLLAKKSLHESLVKPLETYLKNQNVPFFFGHKLRAVNDDRLIFMHREIPLAADDKIILALPALTLSRLVVGAAECETQTIVNVHYKHDGTFKNNRAFVGLLHSKHADFAFARDGVVSVTISAANDLIQHFSHDMIAGQCWQDVVPLLTTPAALPPCRFIANKRATPVQTAAFNKTRLSADIGNDVLFLAGDSADTGLPCTMEGAAVAGVCAANEIIRRI